MSKTNLLATSSCFCFFLQSTNTKLGSISLITDPCFHDFFPATYTHLYQGRVGFCLFHRDQLSHPILPQIFTLKDE